MSCSNCMRRLLEAEAARILEIQEAICDLLEDLRTQGWDADAVFSQDGKLCVRIRRKKSEENQVKKEKK